MRCSVFGLSLLSMVLASQQDALAQARPDSSASLVATPPPAFGPSIRRAERYRWIVGGMSQLTLSGRHYERRNSVSLLPENQLQFAVSPSVALFVLPRFAVGFNGAVEVTKAPGITAWSLSVGPEVHSYVPLSSRLGFLPSLALLYTHKKPDDFLVLSGRVPLTIHLNDHVSLAVGPQVSQDVWRHRGRLRVTTYGLYAGIVGWL